MNSRARALVVATGIGVSVLAVSYGAAFYAYEMGSVAAARVLSWPNTALQSLISCIPIGTPEKPFCEGSALNFLVYTTSFPLGVVVYSAVAYFFLRRRSATST
jgi:hypothetical protein